MHKMHEFTHLSNLNCITNFFFGQFALNYCLHLIHTCIPYKEQRHTGGGGREREREGQP